MMLYYYLLYFFIAFGAKLLLALAMIYMLLPADGRCGECDEETLLIRPRAFGRLAARLTLNRVQWRWCPRCSGETMARRVSRSPSPIGAVVRRPRTSRR